MGHLIKQFHNAIDEIKKDGCISCIMPEMGRNWKKTVADVFSDALCIRPGDWIFPWFIKDKEKRDSKEKTGFQWAFKAESSPVYLPSSSSRVPVKIPLRPECYKWSEFVTEDYTFDLFRKKILWNGIGFKSAGRGKANTHQTFEEDEEMIKILDEKGKKIEEKIGSFRNDNGIKISINTNDLSRDKENEINKLKNYSDEKSEEVRCIDPSRINWLNPKNEKEFHHEKGLEAWIAEFIDKDEGNELRELILGKNLRIEWFGNYLFYGVQGSNIDFVILASNEKNEKELITIELKRDTASNKNVPEYSKQVENYSKFLRKAYKSYSCDIKNVSDVVLTSGYTKDAFDGFKKRDNLKFIGYEINNGKVNFKKY